MFSKRLVVSRSYSIQRKPFCNVDCDEVERHIGYNKPHLHIVSVVVPNPLVRVSILKFVLLSELFTSYVGAGSFYPSSARMYVSDGQYILVEGSSGWPYLVFGVFDELGVLRFDVSDWLIFYSMFYVCMVFGGIICYWNTWAHICFPNASQNIELGN